MREHFISIGQGEVDLTGTWGPLMVSATITDEKGATSDRLTVELDNREGQCQYPDTGQVVSARGGWIGEPGEVSGDFEINQIDFKGWPEIITIHGTPVSAKGEPKVKKTEGHKKKKTKNIGELASKLAKRNGWSPRINSSIASIPIDYEAQTDEHDLQFLRRVISQFGGNAMVKKGNLILVTSGAGSSVSGLSIPPLVIAAGFNLVEYTGSVKAKEKHGKVQSHFFDRGDVKRIDVDAGQGEISYKLKQPFSSREQAKKAAEAKLSDLERASESATFIIEGTPEAVAERHAIVSGVPSRLSRLWNMSRTEHRFTETYLTTCECEPPGTKGSDSSEGSE